MAMRSDSDSAIWASERWLLPAGKREQLCFNAAALVPLPMAISPLLVGSEIVMYMAVKQQLSGGQMEGSPHKFGWAPLPGEPEAKHR